MSVCVCVTESLDIVPVITWTLFCVFLLLFLYLLKLLMLYKCITSTCIISGCKCQLSSLICHSTPVRWLTCPLTHLSIDTPIRWLTYPLTQLSVDSPVCWHSCPLTHLFIDSPVHGLTSPLTHLSVDSPVHWLTCPLTHLFVDSPVCWHSCPLTHLSIDSPVRWHTSPLTYLSIDSPLHWHTSPLTYLSVDADEIAVCYVPVCLCTTFVQCRPQLSRATLISHLVKCPQICASNGHDDLTTVCLLNADTLTATQIRFAINESNPLSSVVDLSSCNLLWEALCNTVSLHTQMYGDGAGNTVEENSYVFSLVQMC